MAAAAAAESSGAGRKIRWVTGRIAAPAGAVPQVSARLGSKDILGAWKVRCGIKRMNYRVDPGLNCVGRPDRSSPVLVTANYKLSFDTLRSQLEGTDAWILVLDTKGINVCLVRSRQGRLRHR